MFFDLWIYDVGFLDAKREPWRYQLQIEPVLSEDKWELACYFDILIPSLK